MKQIGFHGYPVVWCEAFNMILSKVVFDTKGRRNREIKSMESQTFFSVGKHCLFNDDLSRTDYTLNTFWLKRHISIFSSLIQTIERAGYVWGKRHFVSFNYTVQLSNDPRLCSQTWHLGLRTVLPCSILVWFPHAEPGRRLWENPFVKLTVFHGYRQLLSKEGFWVIMCLTKRNMQPVFRRILHT